MFISYYLIIKTHIVNIMHIDTCDLTLKSTVDVGDIRRGFVTTHTTL